MVAATRASMPAKPEPAKAKAPRSPERAALQALVGKPVRLHLKEPIGDMRTLTAYLRWVDMFTLGLSMEPKGQIFVLWKGALVALGPE